MFLLAAVIFSGCAGEENAQSRPVTQPRPWAAQVNREVGTLGYGNWIVIADASFPVHSRRGVRTIIIDAEIPEVLDQVVTQLEYSDSVKPYFTTAQELPYIENDKAPGISTFRGQLKTALHGHGTRQMDYRTLSLMVEDSSNKFAVLVLKTKTTLPYTSVFIELHNNYWDIENERNLRKRIRDREEKKKANS